MRLSTDGRTSPIRIWSNASPKQTPLNGVNYDRLYGGGPDGYSRAIQALAQDDTRQPIPLRLVCVTTYPTRNNGGAQSGKEPPD